MNDESDEEFLSGLLHVEDDDGKVELATYSHDVLGAAARWLRERAWTLREAERMVGATRLSSHAVRNLERAAEKLEKNVSVLMATEQSVRDNAAERRREREKRRLHREYMRAWHRRRKAEMSRRKAWVLEMVAASGGTTCQACGLAWEGHAEVGCGPASSG